MAIAKMNRLFMVGPSLHKEETMRILQEVGAVHLEPVLALTGDMEKKASAALLRLRKLVQIEQAVSVYTNREKKISADCDDDKLASFAEETLAGIQETKNRRQTLERLVLDIAPWGDFNPEDVRHLENNGVYIRRWRIDRKNKNSLQIPENVFLQIVREQKDMLFYTVSLESFVDISGATPLAWPEIGLSGAVKEIQHLLEQEEALASRLAGIALRLDVLKRKVADAFNEARYLESMGTLYAEEYLFGLQGWIPAEITDDFLKQIDQKSLPLQVEIRKPLPEEEPPVLLKNNRFIQRIEPLLKLYGLPHYRKLDPSYFFAPFMVLFFGICLGDVGYGVVFYLVSHLIGRKWGKKVEALPLVVKLCKTFAVSAIIVGIITGSIFGYNFEDRRWILLDLSVGTGNPMILFFATLGLGVLHLCISYILGIFQTPQRHLKLQKLGQLFVLCGSVLLVIKTIWFASTSAWLGTYLYYSGAGFLGLGIFVTLIFSNDQQKWPWRIGVGLWNVYGLTGLIGDLLSYARLFGLGIGTAAIASVMNQLAQMVLNATGPIIGLPLAVMIIIFGHAFNLALALLGSTVHSARLHFVEAFKSFFEGGGIEYKPFKIERGQL